MSEANTKDMTIEAPGKKPEPGLKQGIKPNTVNSTGVLTDAQASDKLRDEALENFMHPEDKPKQVKKKMNWTKVKIAEVSLAGIAILGGLGIGVNQIIKSHEPVPVPEYFDPSALKSVIGPNDSIQIPASEYFASAPTIWNEQDKTMTTPIPVIFRDGRTPTLTITKIPDPLNNTRFDIMGIDGFEQGDILLSPIDGELEVEVSEKNNLTIFWLRERDPQGRDINICVGAPPMEPLINLDQAVIESNNQSMLLVSVKKGQPIGKILASDKNLLHSYGIGLTGGAPFLKNFNLATTIDEKAIILK
jgi:hypothetical protein